MNSILPGDETIEYTVTDADGRQVGITDSKFLLKSENEETQIRLSDISQMKTTTPHTPDKFGDIISLLVSAATGGAALLVSIYTLLHNPSVFTLYIGALGMIFVFVSVRICKSVMNKQYTAPEGLIGVEIHGTGSSQIHFELHEDDLRDLVRVIDSKNE